MMRLVALSISLLLSASTLVYAQQQRAKPHTVADIRGTEQAPLVVKTLVPQKSEAELALDKEDRNEKTLYDRLLVFFTSVLAVSTVLLWWVTKSSADAANRAAEATNRNYEAVVASSMPFLQPVVIGTGELHIQHQVPSPPEFSHRPGAKLVFANLGATPAMIREVGTELLLIDNDQLPNSPPRQHLVARRSDAVIPGHTTAGSAISAMDRPFKFGFHRAINAVENDLLFAKAKGSFKRFFLTGYVVYDDFFGQRTTHYFGVKVRASGWQAVSGGTAYNYMTRDATPRNEEPTVEEEEND